MYGDLEEPEPKIAPLDTLKLNILRQWFIDEHDIVFENISDGCLSSVYRKAIHAVQFDLAWYEFQEKHVCRSYHTLEDRDIVDLLKGGASAIEVCMDHRFEDDRYVYMLYVYAKF